MKMMKICPYCKMAGTSVAFERNHFENCVHHPDPILRKKAIQRVKSGYVKCSVCGYESTPGIIKAYHNEKCSNHAVVAMNLKTQELRFYRWLHHASADGFNIDFIRQVLNKRRVTTKGFTFRVATEAETEEGRVMTRDGLRTDNSRGVRVIRISPFGVETTFNSITEAAQATPKASTQKISEVIMGDRKTHAGFSWRRGGGIKKPPKEL
ncbi:hypothetical protein NAD41_000893 [Salmonella enterica]|nr:hypothetical protein [Salmonella enterica]EKK6596277.1 hypothetical protein [Salmonella enterica]